VVRQNETPSPSAACDAVCVFSPRGEVKNQKLCDHSIMLKNTARILGANSPWRDYIDTEGWLCATAMYADVVRWIVANGGSTWAEEGRDELRAVDVP